MAQVYSLKLLSIVNYMICGTKFIRLEKILELFVSNLKIVKYQPEITPLILISAN